MSLPIKIVSAFVKLLALSFAMFPARLSADDSGFSQLSKRFFAEAYVAEVQKDPYLYLKHLTYVNSAVARSLMNSPQTLRWNRAKRLMQMKQWGDAVDTYLGAGSPVGIGINTPILSLDLKPVVVGLGRRFMGLAPLSKEELHKEVLKLSANTNAVRATAGVLYDAQLGVHEYKPFNALAELKSDLPFSADSPPSSYFDTFSPGTRVRLVGELDKLSDQDRWRLESDWSIFGEFIWTTVWAGQGIDSTKSGEIPEIYQTYGIFDRKDAANLFGDFELGPKSDSWWQFEDSPHPSLANPNQADKEAAKNLRQSWAEFGAMVGHLEEIAQLLGVDNDRGLKVFGALGNIAYATEALIIEANLDSASQGEMTGLQEANIYLFLFKAVLTTFEAAFGTREIDPEIQRFETLLVNQIRIMESVEELKEEVREVQVMLGSIQQLVLSSEIRVRSDLSKLSQKISDLQRRINSSHVFLTDSLRELASQEAFIAWQTLSDLVAFGNSSQLYDPIHQRSFSSLNQFVTRGVANPPFQNNVDVAYSELVSRSDPEVFVSIANTVEAIKFYNLSEYSGWTDIPSQFRQEHAAIARNLIDRFGSTSPKVSAVPQRVHERSFVTGLDLISDIVARTDPRKDLPFNYDNFRRVFVSHEETWQGAVMGVPVLFQALVRDLQDAERIFVRDFSIAAETVIGAEMSKRSLRLHFEGKLDETVDLLVCLQGIDGIGTDAFVKKCPQFRNKTPAVWSSGAEDHIPLMQELGLVSSVRRYEPRDLFFDGFAWVSHCNNVYCRRQCVEVVAGYSWTPKVAKEYAIELRDLNDFFEGLPTNVRRVCKVFPAPNDRSFEDVEPGLFRRFADIDSSCINGQGSCKEQWQQVFPLVWRNYFLPDLDHIFFAGEDEKSDFPKIDGAARMPPSMPMSKRLEREDKFAEIFDQIPLFLRAIASAQLDDQRQRISSAVGESAELQDALEHVDRVLWSLAILDGHLSRDCRKRTREILKKTKPILANDGRTSLISEAILYLVANSRYVEARESLRELKASVDEAFDNLSRGAPVLNNCYGRSLEIESADGMLSFLERVGAN